jgi:hypothetical protein
LVFVLIVSLSVLSTEVTIDLQCYKLPKFYVFTMKIYFRLVQYLLTQIGLSLSVYIGR